MTIELNPITSGYSTGLINDNFQALEDYVNDYLLHRDGVETGQPNQMELPLDMNSNPIINAITDIDNEGSLLTVGAGDARYINVSGDTMEGPLSMGGYPITVRVAIADNEPARKGELDVERGNRQAGDSQINNRVDEVEDNYQSADASIQAQLTGSAPLEASAFSEISWHGQEVENSVTIPDNKNAWSFGPTMAVAAGQSVTIGTNSFWTIANGEVQ